MRIKSLENLLTAGLIIKGCALVFALVMVGPPIAQGPATVEAQEQQPAPGDAPAEEAQGGEAQPAEGEAAPADQPPPFDPRVLRLLEEKRAQLALEEQRLARERKELEKLRAEVTQRVAELKKVQGVLEKLVKEERNQRQARIQQLVKVLSNMRPDSASAVVAKLDDQMAVEIFNRMQSRIAGKVMAGLEPEQAARISVLLTRQQEANEAARLAAEVAPEGAKK